jgi:DNA-binding NarL/FixJ family response regulator
VHQHEGGQPETVSIDVESNVLHLALDSVATNCGLQPIENCAAATYRVADSSNGHGPPVDVLVVEPVPVRAALALDAVHAGRARAVVSTERPEDLSFAIESVSRAVVTIPTAIVDVARLPPLTSRQHRLLGTLTNGHPKVSVIADRLGCSVATIKRELLTLYDAFGVASRHELAEVARSLGYTPQLADGVPHHGRL